jgi:hypothetical protein
LLDYKFGGFLKIIYELLIFCPILIFVIAINYIVDPANLFDNDLHVEKGIAKLNLSNWNVAVPLVYADYDERAMHSYMINGFPKEHDVLVFGSSRVRQITREMFISKTFYNFASAAATLEDFWIYYTLYKDRGFIPKKIILGMEHWMLDKDPGYYHWKTFASLYYGAISINGFNVPDNYENVKSYYSFEKLLELLSPAYFQTAIKKVFSSDFTINATRFYATHDELAKKGEWLQRYDGSAGERLIPRTVEEVREKVITEDDGVSPLREIDSKRVKLLTNLITLIKSDGIEVFFVLPPVHPITYKKWSYSKKGAIEAEKFYRKFAIEKVIQVIGSYNPENVAASEKDFMDWVHPRRNLMSKIINTLNEIEK